MTNSDSIDSKKSAESESTQETGSRVSGESSKSSNGTETVAVRMADATTSKMRVFPAQSGQGEGDGDGQPVSSDRPLIVMWPGWGMGARYHDPMGRELASRGFNVVTGELHGQGSSTARASRTRQWGYHDMASQDYPRTIRAAKERFGLHPDHPVVLLCHSMGGQIGSLFLARPEATEHNVVGMVGVGAGTPFYQGFSGTIKYRLQFGAPVMRLVANVVGYQPEGRFDFAGYGRQSGTHVKEWVRLSRTNHFINLRGADLNYEEALQQVKTPIVLLRFRNDYDCTTRSAKNLASKLPKSTPVNGEDEGPAVKTIEEKLGHNRWAREPETIATCVEEFVSELGLRN